jgi:protein involved in polysaccharide export with SLBB domain
MHKAAPLLILALAIPVSLLHAQAGASGAQLPPGVTPEQAAAAMQGANSSQMIQNRLVGSGLSPDEVRARLSAAGYPASLLDQYMRGDSGASAPPTPQAVAGMRALGLSSFAAQDSLLFFGDTLGLRLLRDSLRLDSIFREELRDRAIPKLKVFGLDAFRRPTSEFRTLTSGPIDENYRLGPGDGLALILTGEIENAYQLDVTREGSIFVPDVGQIYVNNLSLAQLRDLLYTRLGRVYSGVSRRPGAKTTFDVTVTKVRAVSVRVIGEVARPGAYQVGATGGVLSALYEAGGVSDRGTFRSISVRRGEDSVGSVDLYRYLLTGATPTDLRLTAGDVVFVPVRGTRIKISGEVVRPAVYELRPNEGLRDLIRFAGGLTPQAATSNVTIARILPPDQRTATGRERTVVTVDLKSIVDPAGPNPPLFPDDSVAIFPVRGARTASVQIHGSVWQPGTYRLESGMRLWDLIRMAGGLRPETYAGRAQIVRSRPDSTRVMVGVILDSLAPNNNPALAELDNITLFPKTEFRPDRFINVYGAVRKPGMVSYSDSMTLRDAVLLAGGTTEDAYLAQAEVARIRMDGATSGDSTAVALRVPLDSSYVADPTGYFRRPVGTSTALSVPLEPFDNIYIRRQPGLEAQRTVVISGEVKFPGRYTLLAKDERLSDLIARAGGLTSRAYPSGVRFYRRPFEHTARGSGLVSAPESPEVETSVQNLPQPVVMTTPPVPPAPPSAVTTAQTASAATAAAALSRAGISPAVATAAAPTVPSTRPVPAGLSRLDVDLDRVLKDAKYKDNIALTAGDSIHIPTYIPVVLVEGAVNAPRTVSYVPGASRNYYISAAGGFTASADKKRAFVEQPNGHIQGDANPAAGSVVVVPVKETTLPNPVNIVTVLGVVAQLLSAATAIVVVVATH